MGIRLARFHGGTASPSFAFGATGCPTAWQSFDVTSAAQGWVANSSSNLGMRLGADEVTTAAYKRFYSGDSGSSTAPQLIITYDNVPTTLASVHRPTSVRSPQRSQPWPSPLVPIPMATR